MAYELTFEMAIVERQADTVQPKALEELGVGIGEEVFQELRVGKSAKPHNLRTNCAGAISSRLRRFDSGGSRLPGDDPLRMQKLLLCSPCRRKSQTSPVQ